MLLVLCGALLAAEGATTDPTAPATQGRATAGAPVVAVDGATWSLMARAEGRDTGAAQGVGATGVDARTLTVDVGAGAAIQDGLWTLNAQYQPRLWVSSPDETGGNATTVMHNGRFSAQYLISPLQTLRLDEGISYGRQDFSPLVGGGYPGAPTTTTGSPGAPQGTPGSVGSGGILQVPVGVIVPYVSSNTGLTYSERLSPLLSWTAHGGFFISGGTDAYGRQFLPLQKGGEGSVSTSWHAAQFDTFTLSVNGMATHLSNNTSTQVLGANAAWKTILGEATSANVSVGGGAAHTTAPGALPAAGATTTPTASASWQPTASAAAGLSHTVSFDAQTVGLGLGTSLSTAIDPASGNFYELLEVHGTASYAPVASLYFALTGSAGRALNSLEQGQALASFDFSANWRITPQLAISAGGRGAYLSAPYAVGNVVTSPSYWQWAGYAAISVSQGGHF
jgi:hypothetical protein